MKQDKTISPMKSPDEEAREWLIDRRICRLLRGYTAIRQLPEEKRVEIRRQILSAVPSPTNSP